MNTSAGKSPASVALLTELNTAGTDSLVVPAEHLEVVVTKR